MHRGNGVASVWGKNYISRLPIDGNSLTGDEHKKQRKLIDPIFTAARIAKLTPLFYQVAYQVSL